MHQADLIFDVGMHLGEDTDFYLKKGFRVVAFEANPELVQRCKSRFCDAIAAGRLTIVEGAVASGTASKLPFYVNTMRTVWSTVDHEWVIRNERRGFPSRQIEVSRVDIIDHFRHHGMPYYLKIDIEGADHAAALSVQALEDRPRFISIESDINRFSKVVEEINLLRSLGYRKFKPVQQMHIKGTRVLLRTRDGTPFEHVFEPGASGPFGEDLAGEWFDYKECCRIYRAIFSRYWAAGHFSPFYRLGWHKMRARLQRVIGDAGWHDLHASL